MDDQWFKNKVALITGGSFGIGRATAIAFAKQGASVVVADWIEDDETVDQIKSFDGTAIFVKADVSDEEDVKHMIDATIRSFGKLNFAFNNAGIEGDQAFTADCTQENWQKTIGINLTGIWQCMKNEIPSMLEQGGGSIVNCASVAGLVGYQGLPAYVASKHGVVGLTKTTALEYARKGIRINAVCPGAIKTAMIDRITGKDKVVEKQFEEMEPIGRMGEPEEVAEAVLWLCSHKASFVTGNAMAVDGGWIAK